MENLKERYIQLLQEKLDALYHMRDVTINQVFTGDEAHVEAEAEGFINLYEKRGEVLERVNKIDAALELLDPPDAEDPEDTAFQEQVLDLRQKMTALAKEMVEMDKANIAMHEKISLALKGSMKQARQSMDLLHGYDDYIDAGEGHYVDKKKV